MIRSCVFRLPADSKEVINTFHLEKILANERTSIYQNDEMRFSFDKKVLRVLIFDGEKEKTEKLYKYFYGE